MSRKKVTVVARELTDMDVTRLSLVKRGANRIPIRITKSGDKDMTFLNFDTLFLRKGTKDDPARNTPTLVGVAIADGAHTDEVIPALKASGFEVDHVLKDDKSGGVMLMFSPEAPLEDVVAYKMSDDVAMLFTGIQKGLDSWADSGDFVENITTAGFIPSFRVASGILQDTVSNLMYEEGSADVTKSAVAKALSDYSGYVLAVLNTVPVNAFKVEQTLEGLACVQKGMNHGLADGGQDALDSSAKGVVGALAAGRATAIDTARDVAIAAAKEKDGDNAQSKEEYEAIGEKAASRAEKQWDKAVAQNAGDDAGADAAGEDSGADAGADAAGEDSGDDETAVAKALAAMTTSIEGMSATINKKIDGVSKDLTGRLDQVEANVKKTEEVLEGTVHSQDAGDADGARVTKDGDEVSFDNVLDFGDVELS